MRGQVTPFIMIAVIIIIAAGILLYSPEVELPGITFEDRVLAVRNFVQGCVEQSATNGLMLFGETGGLIYPSLDLGNYIQTADFGSAKVNYWQYLDINTVPSKEWMEDFQLSEFIRIETKKCTGQFVDFTDLEITAEDINATSTINDNSVIFDVNYPITIKQQEQEATLDKFTLAHNVRLGSMIKEGVTFLEKTKRTQGYAPVGMTVASSFNTKIIREGNIFFFALTDDQSIIKQKPFTLVFATRFAQ
ncbi:MAG: hypothetical protein ACE5FT_06520 [Candidatus Nanoarchaeia archaeon]